MRLWISITLLSTIFAMLCDANQADSIPHWKYKAGSRKSRPRLLGGSIARVPNQPLPGNNQPPPLNNQPPPAPNRPLFREDYFTSSSRI
ncbi:hypothetical protein Aduo_002976 [Ancylostoma duodenale]